MNGRNVLAVVVGVLVFVNVLAQIAPVSAGGTRGLCRVMVNCAGRLTRQTPEAARCA